MALNRISRILFATLGVIALGCMWIEYLPEYSYKRITFANVQVDGRPVKADVYRGHPTQNEAGAFALVHKPGVGDCRLNFDDALVREASKREFIRLGNGGWTLRALGEGNYSAPLPFKNFNEFRIVSPNQHVITIAF